MTTGEIKKLFIPYLTQKIKLTEDVDLKVHDLEPLMECDFLEVKYSNQIEYEAWSDEYKQLQHTGTYEALTHARELYNELIYGKKRLYNILTFKKGINLSVDRIYIRKGAKDFDSLTFRILSDHNGNKIKNVRFYLSLEESNKIVCEVI